MSKELFQKYREEEVHTMVSVPYNVYQWFLYCSSNSVVEGKIELIKHYIPSNRDKFKKDKRWMDLEQTIKECREEQKDIEFELTNETRGSLTESK